MKRPALVTVGVVALVAQAALYLMVIIVGVLAKFGPHTVTAKPESVADSDLVASLGTVVSVGLLWLALAFSQCHRWARLVLLWLSWLGLATAALLVAAFFSNLQPDVAAEAQATAQGVVWVWALPQGLLAVGWLWMLWHPSVRAAFARQVPAAEENRRRPE